LPLLVVDITIAAPDTIAATTITASNIDLFMNLYFSQNYITL
jgi:hypothetical protein